jgi:hypothetical protein
VAILVSSTDPRAAAAIQIVIDDKWKGFHDGEGRPSWSLPSRTKSGLHYRVTENGCTCPDVQYRPWLVCAHILALRLYLEMSSEDKDALYAF